VEGGPGGAIPGGDDGLGGAFGIWNCVSDRKRILIFSCVVEYFLRGQR
jgi:hypothetical protein